MRLFLTLTLALLATPAFAATSYLVTQTTITISESNVCQKVSAPTGTRYISTQTASEWSSFYTNPNGLNVASCCAGTLIGGYCWYMGAANQTCDTVCASHGTCNSAGTVNYAGSGGTLANCTTVGQTLKVGSPVASDVAGAMYAGMGCMYLSPSNFRTTVTTTCAGAPVTGGQRYCACNN